MDRPVLRYAGLLLMLVAAALAQNSPTLTVINNARDAASVRVVGPSPGSLEVASGTSQTVAVSGGIYYLKVRYCNSRGDCSYTRTGSFTVTQTPYSVSEITVTLHSTGGNLNERSISESEFNGSY